MYPGAFVSFVKDHVKYFKKDVLLTDVMGIKGSIPDEIDRLLGPEMDFVPAHPMAGREGKGYGQSTSRIFEGANFIVIKRKENRPENVAWLRAIALQIGCGRVVELSAREHDGIIAYTSDLPHIMAVSLMNSDSMKENTKYFIAGSFRDATRVADINGTLWSDLFLLNKEPVIAEIERLETQLEKWKKALKEGDRKTLLVMMDEAKKKRRDMFYGKIDVALGQDSYTIEIARGLWKDVGTKIRSLSKAEKVAVITDDTVDALYGKALEEKLSKEGFMVRRFIFPHGEHHKTLAVFETMVRACAQFGMTRSDLVVALGGGVVGDLAGFVAASFLRGIDFIQIPTTLLSQIDSSVGGKVAVDLPEGKNLVGAFYQPRGVFIDPDLLDTLPVRYLHDGFAEVIKCGAFGSADFLPRWNRFLMIGRFLLQPNPSFIAASLSRLRLSKKTSAIRGPVWFLILVIPSDMLWNGIITMKSIPMGKALALGWSVLPKMRSVWDLLKRARPRKSRPCWLVLAFLQAFP